MSECGCCQFSCHVISVDAFHPVYSYLLHHLINVITVRDNQLSGRYFGQLSTNQDNQQDGVQWTEDTVPWILVTMHRCETVAAVILIVALMSLSPGCWCWYLAWPLIDPGPV